MTDEPRVTVITGASGGLGGAVVEVFRKRGDRVIGIDRKAAKGIIAGDLTDPTDANRAVREAAAPSGRIDSFIHLLGGFAGGKLVEQTDDTSWQLMMALNLTSAFYTTRAALPMLKASQRGRLVMIGARAAVEPGPNLCAYNASKAGLVALAKTIAAEMKGTSTTANVVLPSAIDTPANRSSMPQELQSKLVKPESIARLLLFLASDDAADINGAVVPIYGGL